MEDFCRAIRSGSTPRSSAQLGLDVVRMIEAAERSRSRMATRASTRVHDLYATDTARAEDGKSRRLPGRDGQELRVLVLTNMYPTRAEPSLGCFVRDQVDDLRRLGVDVTVLAFDGRGAKAPVRTTASPACAGFCGDGRFDLVHAHYGLSGAVAALQLRTPIVTTFHGSDACVPWQRRVSWLVARRTRPIAVAPVIAANLGLHDAAVIPCAVDLDAVRARSTGPRPGVPWAGRRTGPACSSLPPATTARRSGNKRVDVFDGMVERLRRGVPDVYAASLDGLPRAAGRPGDERRRRRRR